MATIDALVIGRRTYDKVLEFASWPYEGKRCVVLAHSPPEPRHGEEFTVEAPAELVDRLGREGARRIYVDGGAVIRSFLTARLVDDMTLSVIPTVLGDGVPLFEPGLPEQGFVLDEAKSFPTGLVQASYSRRVAKP
jgi:dihydrofolate reductase